MKTSLKIFFPFLLLFESTFAQPIYWQRIYGLNSGREGKCAIETFDGGFLILIRPQFGSGYYGTNVVKTNRYGDKIWEKSYLVDATNSVIQTADSGYVFVGNDSRATAFKINKDGDSLWYKQFGLTFNDQFFTVQEYYDHGLLLLGRAYISGKKGAFIVRTNSNGNPIWQDIITDTLYSDINAFDLLFEKNNNIIVTGFGNSDIPQNSDILLFKFNENGNCYFKKFLYTYPQRESAVKIIKSYDGNYILSGGAPSIGICALFQKIDTSGNVIFQKFFNNCTNVVAYANGGNYMLGGTVNNGQLFQYALRKVNADGDEIWFQILNENWSQSFVESFIKTKDGGFLFSGSYQDTTVIPFEVYSPYIARTDSNGNTNSTVNIFPITSSGSNDFNLFPSYPNPFNSNVIISFEVNKNDYYKLVLFDLTGRVLKEIFNKYFQKGKYQVKLHDEFLQLPSSVYFVRLISPQKILNQKLLYIK